MSRTAVRLALLFLAFASLGPIARTLYEAFIVRDANGAAHFTLQHLAAIGDASGPNGAIYLRALGNSVAIALLSALFALALGVPYALLVARTDLPGRGFFGAVYAAPLVLPPLLVAVSWTMLFSDGRAGALQAMEASPWQGVIGVTRAAGFFALGTFPLVVLFVTRALRQIPAGLEESARLSGGPWRTLRSVTLPLVRPAALASATFVFLFALHDFSLVDFLNWVRPLPQQVSVYPFLSFDRWSKGHGGEHEATAAGLPLGMIGAALLVFVLTLTSRQAASTVGGDFREPARWRLSAAGRFAGLAFAAVVLVLAAGIPVAGLVRQAGGLESYRRAARIVAGPESATHEFAWTMWLAGGAALLAIVPAFVLAHNAARKRTIGAVALACLPLVLPPIFLGVGALRLWSTDAFALPLPSGGSRNPLTDVDGPRLGAMLVLVAKYIPFAIAALWAAFLAIDPKLEEAAATAGARRLDRALAITAPLAGPAIGLALVLVFVFSIREIDTIVLLSSDTLMRRIYTMVHFQRDDIVAALAVLLVGLQFVPFAVFALLLPRKTAPATARA